MTALPNNVLYSISKITTQKLNLLFLNIKFSFSIICWWSINFKSSSTLDAWSYVYNTSVIAHKLHIRLFMSSAFCCFYNYVCSDELAVCVTHLIWSTCYTHFSTYLRHLYPKIDTKNLIKCFVGNVPILWNSFIPNIFLTSIAFEKF